MGQGPAPRTFPLPAINYNRLVQSDTALAESVTKLNDVREEIGRVIVGQQDAVDGVLICLLSGGHVLLEGVPGLGKTTLAHCAATEMEVNFEFQSSRRSALRHEARLSALQAAKQKAQNMAEVVGASCGRAVTIDEHSPSVPTRHLAYNAMRVDSRAPSRSTT